MILQQRYDKKHKHHKHRKRFWTAGRRVVCGLLCLSVAVQPGAGISMVSAAEEPPVYLEASRITGDDLPEGDWLYFGTASANVNEQGEYAIRVFREGDLKKEASVSLRTIDMTAVYGEDYELVEDDVEDFEDKDTDKSLLEMYAKGKKISSAGNEESAQLFLGAGQTPSPGSQETTDKKEKDTAAGVSELAAKKSSQTGEDTRALTETEDKGLMDAMAQQTMDDATTEAMQNLAASTTGKLRFAKGESEKVVRFRILEDEESEGTEGFSLLLAEPKGAELYQVGTAGITIEDDEEAVKSEVSFSEKEYQAEDGVVKFTVKRTGAEYSVCDMILMTSEDTAVAGENYTAKNETLSFAPYEKEKTIEMDVTGSGKFTVLLTELHACTEGKYMKASITIPQEQGGAASDVQKQSGSTGTASSAQEKQGAKKSTAGVTAKSPSKKASGSGEQSRVITLNKKKYTVYYKMGDLYGRIMDESYQPPLEVGRYYFPIDDLHGGNCHYSWYGDDPKFMGQLWYNYHEESKTPDTMENNYGILSYGFPFPPNKGGTRMVTGNEDDPSTYKKSGLPGMYFQYFSPDFAVKKRAVIANRATSLGARHGVKNYSWETRDSFGRTQDKAIVPQYDNTWRILRFDAEDDSYTDAGTFEIQWWGLSAMYRKLNISVRNPEKLTYRTGKDSAISMEPTNMYVKCGAQPNPLTASMSSRDVYANPDDTNTNFVFSTGSMSLNGHEGIFGYIKGYDITIDNKTQNDRIKVKYPEDFVTWLRNLRVDTDDIKNCPVDLSTDARNAEIKKIQEKTTVVPYDGYFFSWLGSLTGDGNNGKSPVVASDGIGWKNNLTFKPRMEYYDVPVKVLPAALGEESVTNAAHFTDTSLKENQSYTFHAGDAIDLSVKSVDDNKYHAVGYQVSTDGGAKWDTITSTELLFLEYDKQYLVRPIVTTTNNCIKVRFKDKEAEKRFEIQGLMNPALLKGTDMEGENVLLLNEKEKTPEKMAEPVPGEYYPVRIVVKEGMEEDSDGYVYRPMIKSANGRAYATQYYLAYASNRAGDNVIEISCSRIKKSELRTWTLKGKVVYKQIPIRQTATAMTTLPAAGFNVAIGTNTQSTGTNKKTGETTINIDTATTTVEDDGEFTLSGIVGAPGDRVAPYVSYGGNIVALALETYLTDKGYGQTEDGQIITQTYVDNVQINNTPKVTWLDYDYDKAENRQKQGGNTENTVHIYDDTFTMTAKVDPKGRKIKEAIFTVYHFGKQDKYEEYRVKEDPDNKNTFVCRIPKMAESFHNGDGVKIQLVDAEQGVLSVGQYDENGNPILDDEGHIVQGQKVETVYPPQDSGLTFYIENELVYPQTFDLDKGPAANVPLIGSATGNTSSGLLTFGWTWWDNQRTGYTLQVGVDALWSGTPGLTMQQKAQGYQNLHNTVRQINEQENIAKNLPNAEELIMGMTDEDYFSHFTDDEYNASAQEFDNRNAQLTWEKNEMQKIIDKQKGDASSKAKNARASMTKAAAWNIDLALILAFDFVYDPVQNEYIFACGTFAAGGSFMYNKTLYTIVSSVPAFLNFSATLQANATVAYTTQAGDAALTAGDFTSYAGNLSERLANPKANLALMVSGKIQVGVGMCGVLSARGYASVKLQYDIPLMANQEGGILLGATGGIGFDLLVLSINIDIVNASYGTGTLENKTKVDFFGGLVGTGKSAKSAAKRLSAGGTADKVLKKYSDSETLTAHTYSAGTSDMSTFGRIQTKRKRAALAPVSVTPLLDNAAERTRPQIIPLANGKKMMVFIANRDSGKEDDYVLNYSVYDGKKWQTPKAVADDGTVDSTPDILKAGDKVIIAWADAGRAFTDKDDNIDKLSAMDISVTVYDTESGEMGEEKTLVKDGFFDLSPQLAIDHEKIYCTYMKRDLSTAGGEEDLTDFTKIYSTMAYATYDFKTGKQADEKYIKIKHDTLTDPVVLDYQSIIMEENGDTYIVATYTVDEDNDLNTNGDRELFLSITNIDKNREYYPIRLSKDTLIQAMPKLTDIDGTVYLTWLESGYIFRLADVSGLMDGLFNTETQEFDRYGTDENGKETIEKVTIDKAKYIDAYMTDDNENRDWYKKTAAELGLDSEMYEGTAYEELTQDRIPSESANFNQNKDIQESVGNYQLVSDGDDVYVFFTNAGAEFDSTGVEIYGVRYQRAMTKQDGASSTDADADSEEMAWGFGKAVQITHANKVIDELDLYMTKDRTVSAVSNYFDQWIDADGKIQYSKNQLVEIEFGTQGSLEVKNKTITLPDSFVAGDTEIISFDVVNNGLLTTKGYDYKVVQVKDGKETEIASGHEDTKLAAGESQQINVGWEIPKDIADTEINVTVRETGVDGTQPSVATSKVPYRDNLVYEDAEILWNDDGPYVKATIRNKGNAASKAYQGTLCKIDETAKAEKTYESFDVPALKSGEEKQIEVPFAPDVEDFSHLGQIALSLRVSDGDKLLVNKLLQLSSTRPMYAKIGDGKDISLKEGESVSLKTQAAPWGQLAGTPEYSSSDPSVADVDANGKLTANGTGETTLTASYPDADVETSVNVTVSKKSSEDAGKEPATKKITPDKKSVVIAPGKSKSVKFTAVKADSAEKAATVKAKSSNTKVVKATVSGSKVKLTAAKKATKGASATVTLTSAGADGKTVSAKIKVTIQNKTKKLTATKKKVTVKKGKTVKLTLNVTAQNKKKPTTDTVKLKGSNVALKKTTTKKGKIVVSLKGKKKGKKKVKLQVGSKKVGVTVKVK